MAAATSQAAERSTRYVFEVTLGSGEVITARSGGDAEAARAELVSLHTRLAQDPFVQLGEDTIVRSGEVRFVQLCEDDSSGPGLLDSLRSRIGGGDDRHMSGYDTEQLQSQRSEAGFDPQQSRYRSTGQGRPGWADQMGIGYGRRPWAETKPFFLTSEFLAFLLGTVGVLIAAAVNDNLDAPRAWLIVAIIASAYIVSRGFAKSGTREPNPTRGDRDF